MLDVVEAPLRSPPPIKLSTIPGTVAEVSIKPVIVAGGNQRMNPHAPVPSIGAPATSLKSGVNGSLRAPKG